MVIVTKCFHLSGVLTEGPMEPQSCHGNSVELSANMGSIFWLSGAAILLTILP